MKKTITIYESDTWDEIMTKLQRGYSNLEDTISEHCIFDSRDELMPKHKIKIEINVEKKENDTTKQI